MFDSFYRADLLHGVHWFFIGLLVQGFALRRLNPQQTLGDEVEYLTTSRKFPTAQLWVRVPLNFVLPWLAARLSNSHKTMIARSLVSVVSAATVGLAVGFSHSQAGVFAGLTAGLLMTLSLERIVLAIHIWPDTLLGFWSLIFMIAMSNTDAPPAWTTLGVIAALGFLTRVDFAALVCFGVVLAAFTAANPLIACISVAGPTLGAALILTLKNGLVHRVWSPDTTASFNFEVSVIETEKPSAATNELMTEAVSRTQSRPIASSPRRDFLKSIVNAPYQSFTALSHRIVVLLGQETFVSQNLIKRNRASYATDSTPIFGGILKTNVTYWVLIVFVIFVAFSARMPVAVVLLVATLVVVQCAVQTRSRYRMSVFPVLCASVAIAVWQTETIAFSRIHDVVSLLVACGVFWVLMSVPPRRELR